MRHLLFLSYPCENAKDSQFHGFFKDLRRFIATNTDFEEDDDGLAFRDRKNLRVGERWEPELRQALESSSVLVCLTSERYFKKAFCGKEFFVFEQRIRAYAKADGHLPPVIVPVIWAPYPMPPPMKDYVWKHEDFPDKYEEFGLRELRWVKSAHYKTALSAISRRIVDIWKRREGQVELSSGVAPDFEQIPNAFGEEWAEAANGEGFLRGPGVANVVFGAGTKQAVPLPSLAPKYGNLAREWRPYLPPSPETVADLTKDVVHGQSLRYREIPVDKNLDKELASAQERKNLILVVADAASIAGEQNCRLKAFDRLRAEGTALLMPWGESQENPWKGDELQKNIEQIFPTKSRTPACYRAPILSVDQMRSTLDTTLVEIRDSLTKLGASSKPAGDVAPAMVSGAAS